jgi:ubiquitin-like 1-activating enzyme E1 A
VLAGVGSLTLIDDRLVTEEILGANFLISLDDAKSNKSVAEVCSQSLRDFNPMVRVSSVSGLSFTILFSFSLFYFSFLPIY